LPKKWYETIGDISSAMDYDVEVGQKEQCGHNSFHVPSFLDGGGDDDDDDDDYNSV